MAGVVACNCGKSFKAPPELAGKRVKCPACGQPLQIPAANQPVAAVKASGGEPIVVACQCGRSFNAPAHLAGKRVACSACQAPLSIPQPQGPGVNPVSGSDPLGIAADDPLGNLGDFANDPLLGGMPVQTAGSSLPSYGAVGAAAKKKVANKSGFNPRIILYIVGGIGGVILLGCAGLFVMGLFRNVSQSVSEARGLWKPHVSIGSGYAALLPGSVRTKKYTQDFGNFSATGEDAVAVVGNGDEIYISVYQHATFATAQETSWTQKSADAVKPEMPGATVSNATVAGQPAVRIEGVLKIGARTSHKVAWFINVGDRLYDLSILSGDKPADPATVSKFIDSFHLTGASTRPPANASATPSRGDELRKAMAGEWLPLRADKLFTIDFTPGRSASPPTSFTSESLSGSAGSPLMKYYEQSEGNAKFTLKAGYTHQPTQQQGESAAAVFDRFVQSLTADNYEGYTATIGKSSETPLGEHPGREVEVRTTFTSSGRTIQSATRIRFYLVAGRVYWLECKAVAPNSFPESDFRKFVDSFKLL